MDREHLDELVRRRPFEPLKVALTDGRTVVVRDPEQAAVTGRHVLFGLAQIKCDRQRVATPKGRAANAKDGMLVDRLHVASVEPTNGEASRGRKPRRRKER